MNKVMATIKKGLHFFASAFMYSVLLLMVLIFITVIVYVLEQKQTAKDRYVAPLFSAYVIITNSMDPAIAVNDVVIDRKILASSLKIGDIITFVSNDPIAFGKTITHRIVGKDQDKDGFYRFRTKGDNNNIQDNWIVSETHILGKVMFKVPKLGYIQQVLATSYGWIAAIVLPCLIIIIYDIVKLIATLIRSSKRRRNDETNNISLKMEEEQTIDSPIVKSPPIQQMEAFKEPVVIPQPIQQMEAFKEPVVIPQPIQQMEAFKESVVIPQSIQQMEASSSSTPNGAQTNSIPVILGLENNQNPNQNEVGQKGEIDEGRYGEK